FGMPTRTELILLQRTMVVVEGVARSIDPQLNIWDAAKPVVSDYIKAGIGPKAAVRDLTQLVQTVSRYGPLLPRIVEQALWEKAHPDEVQPRIVRRTGTGVLWLVGALSLAVGTAIGLAL
ncbi:MAG: 2-polyprenylphenol 6-hydroxylase, partial [Paracoccus sp. (in: a-proteobacteria)]